MNRDERRIVQLILKNIREGLTEEEQLDLEAIKRKSKQLRLFVEQYQDEAYLKRRLKQRAEVDVQKGWETLNRLREAEKARVLPLIQRKWFRYAAASAVGVFLMLAGWMLWKSEPSTGVVQEKTNPVKNDLLPGRNTAVLQLADGSTIDLDIAQNGALASQGSAAIYKQEGQLTYETGSASGATVLYNTVYTPRGGQYHLVLSDGSKVWLNAASSIRFPIAFDGNKRNVEISGEAYFEIAHDAARPFTVTTASALSTNGASVTVLGTRFNVNAYKEEEQIKVTLVEGKVTVSPLLSKSRQTLTPGQQAQVHRNGHIRVVKDADVEEALAWKNGVFRFNGTDIKTIMRQISRWYDVDIEYEGDFSEMEFVGQISRYNNASQVLRLLEMTGGVRFKITENTIFVSRHMQ